MNTIMDLYTGYVNGGIDGPFWTYLAKIGVSEMEMEQHLNLLYKCNCCEKHQINRSVSIINSGIPNPSDDNMNIKCDCCCRFFIRMILRAQAEEEENKNCVYNNYTGEEEEEEEEEERDFVREAAEAAEEDWLNDYSENEYIDTQDYWGRLDKD